jgi:hypothetical protein
MPDENEDKAAVDAALYADPTFDWSQENAIDIAWEKARQALGPDSRRIVAQWGTPPQSVGAPADATPPTNADSSDPALAEVMEPTTPSEAFIAVAPEIGIAPEEAKAWVTWAEAQPTGGTLQEALLGWPEDLHAEVTALAALGWRSLPLRFSSRAAAELHGIHFRDRAFTRLVKKGLEIQDEEARRLKLAETRPGNARTNDPGRRR